MKEHAGGAASVRGLGESCEKQRCHGDTLHTRGYYG